MEALLALMVVTVAVALLALSFSLAAHDLKESVAGSQLEGCAQAVMDDFEGDHSVWRDGRLVWASLQVKVSTAYDIPEGANGYVLEILDLGDPNRSIQFEANAEMPSASAPRLVQKHACSIIAVDGTIVPGSFILEVW